MSDRIAVINQGRVMQIGEPRKIYEHPVNKFVADFIGDSTFLPVTMSSGRVMYRDTVLDTAAMPDDDRHARRPGMADRLDRPGLQPVVGRHHPNDDIGDVRAALTDLAKSFVDRPIKARAPPPHGGD